MAYYASISMVSSFFYIQLMNVFRNVIINILKLFEFQIAVLCLLMTIQSCQGMSLKNDANKTIEASNKNTANVKEEMEHKFNRTVEKVVEAKMFLLGVLAHTFNKTVDKLMEAKQQIENIKKGIKVKFSSAVNQTGHKWEEMKKKKQDIKEDIKEKFAVTVDQTGHKVEEMKHDLHDYKMTKASARHQPTPVVFVTRDFMAIPEFPIVNYVPTQPLVPFIPSEAPVEAIRSYANNLS